MEWEPLDPKLVAEVQFDHFTGGPLPPRNKIPALASGESPRDCTMKQVRRESQTALGLF